MSAGCEVQAQSPPAVAFRPSEDQMIAADNVHGRRKVGHAPPHKPEERIGAIGYRGSVPDASYISRRFSAALLSASGEHRQTSCRCHPRVNVPAVLSFTNPRNLRNLRKDGLRGHHAPVIPPIRSTSCSMTDSSSFLKSGAGLASGVPAGTSSRCHLPAAASLARPRSS